MASASGGTVKKVRGIFISNIGKKMKNAEKVKGHLASKASVEEDLTVIWFKPAIDTQKGVCVLKSKEEVIVEIEKIHFHNWEVQFFQLELSMLIKCSGQIHTEPVDVIITYSKVIPPPCDKLLLALTQNLLIEEVREQI